jgi:hypothetical protein
MENNICVETNNLTITGKKKAVDETVINGQMTCEDPTLTWSRCRDFDNNQASCESSWQSQSGSELPVSCWYDVGSDDCRGCGPYNEDDGNCTNTCYSGEWCEDTSLSLIPDKDDECHLYDGTDQATCESYWLVGGKGRPAASGMRPTPCASAAARKTSPNWAARTPAVMMVTYSASWPTTCWSSISPSSTVKPTVSVSRAALPMRRSQRSR